MNTLILLWYWSLTAPPLPQDLFVNIFESFPERWIEGPRLCHDQLGSSLAIFSVGSVLLYNRTSCMTILKGHLKCGLDFFSRVRDELLTVVNYSLKRGNTEIPSRLYIWCVGSDMWDRDTIRTSWEIITIKYYSPLPRYRHTSPRLSRENLMHF